MIKRLIYSFLGTYAFFVTLNPLIINRQLSHWDNVKYSAFLALGVTLGIILELAIRKKLKK
jgi:hypothetical protein